MLFFCKDCGRIYREEDVDEEEVYLAEAWGHPVTETYKLCPECGEIVNEYDGEPYILDEYGDGPEEEDDDI